jgi:enamine deaminase RidA (YjgF/YER057c/UK114 family)
MAIIRTNPEGAYPSRGYHHVVATQGGRTLYIAGQVAYDSERKLIGGADVVAQARAVLQNLGHRLAAVGAKPSDVVKITTYVVGYRREDHLMPLVEALTGFFGADHLPANTLIGIDRLAADELLVEIEAVAHVG